MTIINSEMCYEIDCYIVKEKELNENISPNTPQLQYSSINTAITKI